MGQALMARIVQQQAEQQVSAAVAEAGVPSNPDAAWWLKLLARALSVIAAGGCRFVLFMSSSNVQFCYFATNPTEL